MTTEAETPEGGGRQPIFNIPGAVAMLIGAMWIIHVGAGLTLDMTGLFGLRIRFGFIADRLVAPQDWPGGAWPLVWTSVTHAFLHADYVHLALNSAWLAVFGTPVARRYGAGGLMVVFLVGAAAGAVAQALVAVIMSSTFAVLIGASGGVSALTGAAMRFIFSPVVWGQDPETGDPVPLGRRTESLAGVFANARSRSFIVIWLGINFAIGFAPMLMGTEIAIAWEAHIGGFVAGLVLPSVFDAQARRRQGA